MELFIIFSIVLFHELGHYVAAKLYNWRIDSIVLWVFGGVMDTDEHGTKSIKEEAIVTIAGPFQHLIIYFICMLAELYQIIPGPIIELVLYYNTALMFFNLIPVWPLDGGKLLLLLTSSFLPYKKAYQFTILFSMITIVIIVVIQIMFFPFTLSSFLIWAFLFMENRADWKQRYYVFMRFLLSRFEGEATVKKIIPLHVASDYTFQDVFSLFRRERKHTIYIDYPGKRRISIDETDCLQNYFFENINRVTVGEAFDYPPSNWY